MAAAGDDGLEDDGDEGGGVVGQGLLLRGRLQGHGVPLGSHGCPGSRVPRLHGAAVRAVLQDLVAGARASPWGQVLHRAVLGQGQRSGVGVLCSAKSQHCGDECWQFTGVARGPCLSHHPHQRHRHHRRQQQQH